jgi:c-di-GMP-binding flagellar brake protein YcgR
VLKIGNLIYLEIITSDNKRNKYKCKVEDLSPNSITVTYPTNIETNKTEFFLDGTPFNCEFSSKDKVAYRFSTELRGRKKNRTPLLILSYPGHNKLTRVQRREYLRVEKSVDIAVHPTDESFTPFVAVTLDISAGGMSLILPQNHSLKAGQELLCWIVLQMQSGDNYYFKQKCKVLRILAPKDAERDKAPVKYIDINETDRQQMIRYCFEQQLHLKRKDLLS